MRHRVKGKQLNRDAQHRRALYKNLISALIINGEIKTTHAKAKAIQPNVDKLISTAKKGKLHHRRQVDAVLNRTKLVNKLVDEIAPNTGKRQSGFTRIVKIGKRRGDKAMMVRIELVDKLAVKEDLKQEDKKSKKKDQSVKADTKTGAKKPKKTQKKVTSAKSAESKK